MVAESVVKTRYWDQEQWRRRMNRFLLVVLVVLTLLNTVLNYVSIVDRRKIHQAEQVTNDRLSARAEIHILMLVAYAEQRPLSTAEKDRIISLWETARYPIHLRSVLEQIRDRTAVSGQTLPDLKSVSRMGAAR